MRTVDKVDAGLACCAPKDGKGGCNRCPYRDESCQCEDREMLALPAAMVEDIRTIVAEYAAMASMERGNG